MVPNIQTGASFKGAQLYYLHDKRRKDELLRLSDERVAWTAARNTAHDSADEAFAEMIATARDQDLLKMMSGTRLSGRSCEQPVMTISLAWHPSERPSKDEMLRAADSYLTHMKWNEHQSVYVAHDDTAHPHLHIILNRIHPETGRVLDDAFSKNRTQEWARAYEQERGRIWCEERIGKDYTRADGKEPHSMPHEHAIDGRKLQGHYADLEEAARSLDAREKEHLAKHHQDEREAFFDSRHQQFRNARQAAYREVRAEYRPRWVEHFRESDAVRREAERAAANLALQVLDCAGKGDFVAAWEAVSDRAVLRRRAEQQIAHERRELRAEQRAETRERQDEACAALYEERASTYAEIKQRQKEERAELKELQLGRAEEQPYDKDRLSELVCEPVAERMAEAVRPMDEHAAHESAEPEKLEPDLDLAMEAERTAPVAEEERSEAEPRQAGIEFDTAPVTGASDALAGGIGKLAEILADVLGGLIAPETEKERAGRLEEAKKAREKPPRDPPAPQPQAGTSFSFDTFVGEHGERLRREQEEWWRKRNEQKRER